ncbi:type II toxin-antitoxin system HipA family toxin [Castellaniella caeni]|uniref:type II toxin-antitoxin system HipA family toxin n=1 Tax=Castellaniella caeni TaxID=266123 RepID=UPI000C9FA080|nr:type II toxin-antitoxin system HipA family toxin [Castellaniella caeni]
MKLDVHVCGKMVASLHKDRDEYVLTYLPQTDPADFISLAMPVREEPWRWPRDLHPFFRQNLPEGYLLSIIREEFGPLLDGTDLSLLAVVGGTGIGRVTVSPEGTAPGSDLESVHIEQLLKADNTTEHFARLVRRYARASISGMVPKFIAPEAIAGEMLEPLGKPTLRTHRHIIKGSDDSTPFLGFNEFYTLRVLARLDVTPVVTAQMSEDGRVLIVKRFDVDEHGAVTHGVEDACSLLGLPPHEKYATTTERVLTATRTYIASSHARLQLTHFGWQLLANYVVRNADCHAKNIALYYTTLNDVAYTPVYDVVTTQAYPRYATNPPGLPVDGRQTWATGKTLERFFNARLGIPPKQYAEMVERLCESAVEVGLEVIEAAKNNPQWHSVAKNMVHAWNDGMASLRSPKSQVLFKGLTNAIADAGFSDADKPENERTVIGRSELLATRRKK